MLHTSPLSPTIYIFFWNFPGGGIKTLDFIVSNCIGDNGAGIWISDKDSDVMRLVLTIASTSARNVRSDSSFRLVPCIFSSTTKIERADLIWRFHTPSILLAVGGFYFRWIHWPPCSSMNSLIFLWFISENALFSSALASTKFVPLSVLITWTLPLLDTNLRRACMKASVDSEFVDYIWVALFERHVKRHTYLFISLRHSFTKMGQTCKYHSFWIVAPGKVFLLASHPFSANIYFLCKWHIFQSMI